MGEEELKTSTPSNQEQALLVVDQEQKEQVPPVDVSEDKSIVPVSKEADPVTADSLTDRDAGLARVAIEKKTALIKAWEENEKAKVDNKAGKRFSAIALWENSKRASVEAEMKKYEEKMERKKAEYAEKAKNKLAEIRKIAQERRAIVEAKKGQQFLKIDETAEKFRASGYTPKRFLACF